MLEIGRAETLHAGLVYCHFCRQFTRTPKLHAVLLEWGYGIYTDQSKRSRVVDVCDECFYGDD